MVEAGYTVMREVIEHAQGIGCAEPHLLKPAAKDLSLIHILVISPQGAVNFVTLCPLAAVVLHHTGVHFSFCSPPAWPLRLCRRGLLPPCARWLQLFFI